MSTASRTPRQLRRLVTARRWLRRAGMLVAVLLTLIAGEAIIRTEPDRNATKAPYFIAGVPDEPVTAGGLRVTVLDSRGAAIVDPPDSLATDTAGVWVIVRVRIAATTKTTHVRYAALAAADGRSFRASGRFRQRLVDGSVELQPGIPLEGDIAFELPKDVAGLTLRVGETELVISTAPDLQPFTDIRIPMADGDLSRWSAIKEPAAIADAKVGV